jgi:MraZ protein
MLVGEYRHNVDTKGRISVPSKFRDDLGQSFVVTKGLDNCLFAYSKEEWKNLENKLNTLPLTNQEARAFKRFFFSGAAECEVDKQGRVNIPQSLRDYAKLQKDVVIVGLSNRAEIWNNNQWDKYNGQSSDDITKLESQMSKLGI